MASTNHAHRRRAELARIHMLAKELGMDREQYEAVLWTVARVDSAAALDADGRRRVLDHLAGRQRGAKPRYPGAPHNLAEDEQLQKIEALLAEMKLPWRYADSIAQRMWGIERVAWVRDPKRKAGIITALIRRRNRLKGGAEPERAHQRRRAQRRT